MKRRSTPHLVEAKKEFIDTGKLVKVALVEIYCYYHMRATTNPPDTAPPSYLDYEMWTGPAPNAAVQLARASARLARLHGIRQRHCRDMCVHMLDMTRWMLGLGWPTRVSSTGGIFVDLQSKPNITDTQTAAFDFQNLRVVWQHRSWAKRPTRSIRGALRSTATKAR